MTRRVSGPKHTPKPLLSAKLCGRVVSQLCVWVRCTTTSNAVQLRTRHGVERDATSRVVFVTRRVLGPVHARKLLLSAKLRDGGLVGWWVGGLVGRRLAAGAAVPATGLAISSALVVVSSVGLCLSFTRNDWL